MDPLAGLDDSSTDDDAASQTTEDDPQVPERPTAPPPPTPVAAPLPSTSRERPHYELRHTMRGHTSSISAVKFSPDGTLLASCGSRPLLRNHRRSPTNVDTHVLANDKVVKIWSPFTGELIRNLNGHTKGLSDIAWSADSVYLASASDDHTVRIWDVESVCVFAALHLSWALTLHCLGSYNSGIEGPLEFRVLRELQPSLQSPGVWRVRRRCSNMERSERYAWA